jgi:hypothetical protein
MGEQESVHGEGVEAGAQHPAHRARAQVEDEDLRAGTDHDAALAAGEARDHGSCAHDGDGYQGFFSGPKAQASATTPRRKPPMTSDGQCVPR